MEPILNRLDFDRLHVEPATRIGSLSWLIDMRWSALIGQVAVYLLATHVLALDLPYEPLVFVAVLVTLTNEWARRRELARLPIPSWVLPGMIVLDVLLLTVLLFFYGGYTNPFGLVYLVHVVLAAFFLGERWTWVVTALCSFAYGSLFWFYEPVAGLTHQTHHVHVHEQDSVTSFDLHLQGMLIGFILSALLLSFFLVRMRRQLEEREDALRVRIASEEKLAALTTLAASVAHEVRTPLAAIRLTVDDLIAGVVPEAETLESFEAMRADIARATSSLQRLSGKWAELNSERPVPFSVGETRSAILERFQEEFETSAIQWGDSAARCDQSRCVVPQHSLLQVLESLIRNGLEASASSNTPVIVSVQRQKQQVIWEVKDFGIGMEPELVKRIGEPFFSTRDGGRGMGLGLFIAKLFASVHRGSLAVQSKVGQGTIVSLMLPAFEQPEVLSENVIV